MPQNNRSRLSELTAGNSDSTSQNGTRTSELAASNSDSLAQGRSRFSNITTGSNPEAFANSASLNLPAIGQTYTQNWGASNNIWGNHRFSNGVRPTASESGNSQGRMVPLGNGDVPTTRASQTTHEGTEGITGSGSLLSSSESEGFARRGSSQWPTLPSLTNGLGNAQHTHGSASPARARTNQNTRSNSPYANGHLSAMAPPNGQPSRSLLDPRSRSFNTESFNDSFDSGNSGRQEQSLQRPQFSGNLNGFGMNGFLNFSGYASSAASRSGSLPPSRQGTEQDSIADASFPSLHAGNSDIFGTRLTQQSRASVSNHVSQRSRNHAGWTQSLSDISSGFERLGLDQDSNDFFVAPSQVPPSPSRSNGHFQPSNFHRNGSVSLEQDLRTTTPNAYRMTYSDRSNHSPTDSETRRSHDSPHYYTPTPPVAEHNRAPSNASIRSFGAQSYTQAALEWKLRQYAEQQQQIQQSLNQQNFSQSNLGQQNFSQQNFGQQNFNLSSLNHSNFNHFTGASQRQSMFPLNGITMNNNAPTFVNNTVGAAGYSLNQTQNQRGPPRGPSIEAMSQSSLRSPLLDEFRLHKNNSRYNLKDIYGHVVEFSGDQYGSRFIQTKLETANSDEKAQLFSEILPNALQLMTDVFGNYVIQKFFEHGNQTQKKQLADKMKGQIQSLSVQMYACRVVQKAFEHILDDQQAMLVKELDHQVLKCVKDQNGNHVVQKAIQRIPTEHIMFIIEAFIGQVQPLATHPYGCRVVQRLLEHCPEPARAKIIGEIHESALSLITDQYGNYVTQHVIEHGLPDDRNMMINLAVKQSSTYAKHKYASNVIERCIIFGTDEQIRTIVDQFTADGELYTLVGHEFGNYVIQKLVNKLNGSEYDEFVAKLQVALSHARRQSHARQIGQIEKLIESQKATKKTTTSNSAATSTAGAETENAQSQDAPQAVKAISTADQPATNGTTETAEVKAPSSH